MRYPHACNAASFASRTTRNRAALEGSLHKRDNRAVASGIDRAGQRHVKAKILEHERVTPAVEVFDLASACARANAPVPFLRRQRTAKPVEHPHAIRRELVYGGA